MLSSSEGSVIPVLWVFELCGNLGKLCPNTPNHIQRHTKSNPEFSASHFTLNEVFRKCQCNLRVVLYLFWGIWEYLGHFGKSGVQCLNFSKTVEFYYLYFWSFKFSTQHGPINSAGQVVQQILLNNYLKNNFENSEIRDFISTFWNFVRGKSS